MNASNTRRLAAAALLWIAALAMPPGLRGALAAPSASSAASADAVAASAAIDTASVATAGSLAAGAADVSPWPARPDKKDAVVSFGRNSRLGPGRYAQSVVSIFGSSTNEGRAGDVVSIFGNTHVAGSTDEDAVAVFGNTYVDGRIGGDVVAVFGTVELGPNADVGGDVTAVGGQVKRDPGAMVHGEIQDVRIGPLGDFDWLHTWIAQCLLYGRPLAIGAGLAWAWWFALGLLALYALLAAAFREGTMQCVRTLESRPGETVLASLLTTLSVPVLIVLLCITVIGIAAVPFVLLGLFVASVFGKAVVLTWLGRLVTGRRDSGMLAQPLVAVLIGGAIVLALYLVPVLGFLTHQVLTLLGLGAVVYTLLRLIRARQSSGGGPAAAGAAPGQDGPGAPGATAAAAGDAGMGAAATAHAPSAAEVAAMPKAGFWIRIAALLVDAILIGVLSFRNMELLLLAIYGAIMWKLRGSTVGGIVFHLRVARSDGRELDWPTAVIRALGCFLSLAVAGLGFIWIAVDPDKQAWHDKIAGTIVVRQPSAPSLV